MIIRLSGEEYWIEGIGSIKSGLLGHITEIPMNGYHYWEHVCFKENGQVKYLNPSFDECFPDHLMTSINKNIEISKVNIYPNPVKDFINIHLGNFENSSIEIINITGQVTYRKELNEKISQIDVSDYPEGVYFIRITGEDFTTTKKIVKY